MVLRTTGHRTPAIASIVCHIMVLPCDMETRNVTITGCAVAQHCYNGDVSFLWENGKFNPL